MDTAYYQRYLSIVHEDLVPALGCTEPIYQHLGKRSRRHCLRWSKTLMRGKGCFLR